MWEVTEKIDGTNIRIIWDGENVKNRVRGGNVPRTRKWNTGNND